MKEKELFERNLYSILDEYKIPRCDFRWNFCITIADGEVKTISVKEALNTPRERLIGKPMNILKRRENNVIENKHYGMLRSSREINSIRLAYERLRGEIQRSCPGRILAAIVANPERRAEWTEKGLRGSEEEKWQVPAVEQEVWWGLIYDLKEKGIKIEDILDDSQRRNIFWAVSAMRFRVKSQIITKNDFDNFAKKIEHFIPEDDENLLFCLREVSKRFSLF